MHWWDVRKACVCSARNLKEMSICGTYLQACVWLGITVKTFSFWILKALVILSGAAWLVCFHEIGGCDLDTFFFFFEQILISGHQPLLVSGNHTAHYTIFHNRYLWKLLAGWLFSVGRSCEQPLGMSWVCYPWDWSTTGKGDMGHCLPSAWRYAGRNL